VRRGIFDSWASGIILGVYCIDLVGAMCSGRRVIFDIPASAVVLALGTEEEYLCADFSGRREGFVDVELAVVTGVGEGVGDIGWVTRSGRRGIFDGEGLVAIFDAKFNLRRDGVRKAGRSCTCCGQDADMVDSIGTRVPLCLCIRVSAFGTS